MSAALLKPRFASGTPARLRDLTFLKWYDQAPPNLTLRPLGHFQIWLAAFFPSAIIVVDSRSKFSLAYDYKFRATHTILPPEIIDHVIDYL
jgi:hypothetical protein